MSSETGQKTADSHHASETGDKIAARDPAPQETEFAIEEEAIPATDEAQRLEQIDKQYYAEASLTKKIVVFALTTVLILIALGAIYKYWPHTAAAL